MNDFGHTPERLYPLLPAYYRKRDAESGQQLRRLLAALDQELHQVEDDIATLYDNWFIETCEPWVVPYLGDLLGASDLGYVTFSDLRPRALVARVFDYRHRRGTAAGLEAVIRDVLGFRAQVFEYGESTQLHIAQAPDQGRHSGGKGGGKERLSLLPHGQLSQPLTIDVERPWQGPGSRPVGDGDLGLFLQRFPRQTLHRAEAFPLDSARGRYTVHPLGYDTPLFCRPGGPGVQAERQGAHSRTHGATAANLSGRLTADELAVHTDSLYGPGGHLQLYRGTTPIAATELIFTDLSEWRQHGDRILLDPERGRISLPPGETPGETMDALRVDHTTAFGRRMAAGGYPRSLHSQDLFQTPGASVDFHCTVDRLAPVTAATAPKPAADPTTGPVVHSLGAALDLWHEAGQPSGIIRIADSCRHSTGNRPLRIPPGRRLVIEAADGARPVLYTGERGDSSALPIEAQPEAPTEPPSGAPPPPAAALVFDGVVIDGTLAVSGAGSLCLSLHHCTVLAPPAVTPNAPTGALLGPSLRVDDGSLDLVITITSSLVGPTVAPASGVRLRLCDSIAINSTRASAPDPAHLAAVAGSQDGRQPGPETTIEQSTLLGPVHVRAMVDASDSLLLGPVRATQRQTGQLRRCYVPLPSPEPDGPSRPPARLHCIPASSEDSDIAPALLGSVYGAPAFLQLAQRTDRHIRTGAEDSGELGAFHDARLARREAFLAKILADYVPLGLSVDIFYID